MAMREGEYVIVRLDDLYHNGDGTSHHELCMVTASEIYDGTFYLVGDHMWDGGAVQSLEDIQEDTRARMRALDRPVLANVHYAVNWEQCEGEDNYDPATTTYFTIGEDGETLVETAVEDGEEEEG